jgi:hypothetical protein
MQSEVTEIAVGTYRISTLNQRMRRPERLAWGRTACTGALYFRWRDGDRQRAILDLAVVVKDLLRRPETGS